MIAVDTSVVVAGVLAAHPRHDLARPVLARRPSVPLHALLESYAVLTRLPAPLRLDPPTAWRLLDANFGKRVLDLSKAATTALLGRLALAGVSGGAVYDALVAETARRAGATLVTLDERARPTYRVVGVELETLTG